MVETHHSCSLPILWHQLPSKFTVFWGLGFSPAERNDALSVHLEEDSFHLPLCLAFRRVTSYEVLPSPNRMEARCQSIKKEAWWRMWAHMDFLGLISSWVPMAKSVWLPSEKMPSGSVLFLGVREAPGD